MKIVVDSLISKLYESEILELDPNMEIIVLNPEDHTNPAWENVPEVDALFLSYQFLFAVRDHKHLFEPMLEVAKKAKFIQSGYSGMDDPFLQAVLKETSAIVANASSIYGKPMANYVLAQMLRWNKRIDLHGYGGIGKEIARIAKSFEMNVTGVRRSPVTCEFADEVKTPEDLMDMLPFADFLVTVLPDSEHTRNVIDKKVFKQMNPQSMFINVGRGSAVNEADLAEALNTGEIAAAALDTTRKEPLEKESPLWEANNCYITPHDSAHSLMSLPRSFNLFLENVANLKDGKPIKNLFEL